MALYDRIGLDYDTTRKADPEIVARLLEYLKPDPAGRYLDVACGTGNYTIALAEAGVHMVGVDRSVQMIERARRKASSVEWHLGEVEALPFPDRSFSGAICTLAIHHFDHLHRAFREVYRVMSGGRFVLFTATSEQMAHYWLREYFPHMLDRATK